MKKRIKTISIVIILIVIVCLFFISFVRIQIGYKVLGHEYCKGHSIHQTAGDAFTAWTCKICGYSDVNPDTAVPTICTKCAIITGRCQKCGKIKSEKQLEEERLKSIEECGIFCL